MGCDTRKNIHGIVSRVSIHAPTWGATSIADMAKVILIMFQSTHPHGVRREYQEGTTYQRLFQSTHPHGVRPDGFRSRYNQRWFQSTHPHGVRRYAVAAMCSGDWFQSTHPHGVRLCFMRQGFYECVVSIHAPTWGATKPPLPFGIAQKVSIHAPTWGATLLLLSLRLHFTCFNPRTHMGCDYGYADVPHRFLCFNPRTHMGCDIVIHLINHTLIVSIHAPTWGATSSWRL